ncbi:hypothetical protein ACHAXM_002460, partial [Skeletonema potamos]
TVAIEAASSIRVLQSVSVSSAFFFLCVHLCSLNVFDFVHQHSKRSHICANIRLNLILIMFKTTSATEEKNAQEVVIYNHRDHDIENEAPVNRTFAYAADEAEAKAVALSSSKKQTQWRCFSNKNIVLCGVAGAFVGVAGIIGAASAIALVLSTQQQMQTSFADAEAVIGKGRGGDREKKPGKKYKDTDFSWVKGLYQCVLETTIFTKAGGPNVGFHTIVQDNRFNDEPVSRGECPSKATLDIYPETSDNAPWTGRTFVAIFQLDFEPFYDGNFKFYGVGSYNSKGDDEITFYDHGSSELHGHAVLKVTKLSKGGGT